MVAWVVILVIAVLFGEVVVAASDAGRSAADFLNIGQGARAAAMGGAYTAVSEGATAAYWNPAGLANMERAEVALGHFSWYQDITVEQACIALPIMSGDAALAASVTYVNYGTIDGYDEAGAFTGELTAYDIVGGVSVGYGLSDRLSVGVTGKIVNQKLDEYSASALAADFGVKYTFSKVSVAAAIMNVGSDMTFDEVSENLPTSIKLGLAAEPFSSGLMASMEVEKRLDGDIVLHQGLEMSFNDRYYLRTGFDYLPSQDGRSLASGLAMGAGIDLDFAKFDYAFTANDKSTAEDLHRFTLVFALGR
jgi:hypothetical protein